MDKINALLGNLSVKQFLNDYWQKKPLLIRNAIPGFTGLLTPNQLLELTYTTEAQARLVTHKNRKWYLTQGPFNPNDFQKLSKFKWTILVQGVNHTLPQATELLQRFNFIPHTRLDDLMVSYAQEGGGVGPHFDSYDVFLLQGMGHRRWQISSQDDHSLIENSPLRILQNFVAEQEWILNPGDMLYLPPHWAHNGVALDDCMTYSVGFRTPSYQELGEQFLIFQQDNLKLEGMYADPELSYQSHPSEISEVMLKKVIDIISQIKCNNKDISTFLGCYLSEPKPHVFFDPPKKPVTRQRFMMMFQQKGISLDLKTQMLCYRNCLYMNGEAHFVNRESYMILRELADYRQLITSKKISTETLDILYQWYQDGYIVPNNA